MNGEYKFTIRASGPNHAIKTVKGEVKVSMDEKYLIVDFYRPDVHPLQHMVIPMDKVLAFKIGIMAFVKYEEEIPEFIAAAKYTGIPLSGEGPFPEFVGVECSDDSGPKVGDNEGLIFLRKANLFYGDGN